jgi:hypothetical protein
MLAYLAAIVPIVASIYAAGSLLVEHAQRSHDARSYDRIDALIRAQQRALEAERPTLEVHVFNRRSVQILERRALLLRLSGLDAATGTWGAVRRIGAPEGFSTTEVRRQWALLLGSIAGIALLAFDAM